MGLRDVALRIRSSRSVMPTVKAFSLTVFLFALHATPAVAQSMSIPGKTDVGGTGAASYSIPISVPPGTAGVMPALTLSYSSQGSNGIVGVGWSLTGLPSINRCPQTFVRDGVRGGVNFDANDRFCMDGQFLVAISGAYGADGTEYRTEIESFTRVISHGTVGNGPAWFEAHTKSGHIMEFGRTADSQVLAQGKATARNWAVNKVSDTKGNYFTVTYTNDTTNGQAYPIRIDYTGNAATTPALAPYNNVQFLYAQRPDITPTYHAGSLIQTTVRLTNVQTFAGANLVADYRLAYDTTITNLSSLTSVTVCAADGSCLPQTSFAATRGSGGTFNSGTFTYPNGWNFGSPPTTNWTPITGDFNGDGKTDFAFASGTVLNVLLSNGDGTFSTSAFTFPNGWNFGSPPAANWTLVTGDFNGDGKADFAFAGGNSIYVLLSNGDGTFSSNVSSTCGWNFAAAPNGFWWPVVGDFNGDGRTDVVFAGTQVAGAVTQTLITNVVPLFSNGDGTFSCTGTNINGVYAFGRAGNSLWMPVAGDFDGDGKTDIAFLGNTTVAVFQSNGDGTFTRRNFFYPNGWAFSYTNPTTHGKNPPSFHYSVITGDFNADGKADFAFGGGTTFYIFLGKGDGTFSANAFTYPNGWNFSVPAGGYFDNRVYWTITGDFNGDGKTDFAFSSATVAYGFVSNGDETFSTNAFTYPNGWNFGSPLTSNWTPITGDFNGDGQTDFAFAGATSLDTLLVAGPPFYQLNAVTNGLGASTAFTYQPLTSGSIYTKDTNATYPVQDIKAPLYVVSRVDTSNGIGGTYSATYSYAGAKIDLSGRGFLGFRQMTATDLQTNVVVSTNTRQDYPYIGLTASTTKTLGSLMLNATTNTYQFSNAGGAPTVSTPSNTSAPYQVSVGQSVANSSDLDGTAMPTVTTTNQYDTYGNATQVVVSTSDGFSKTTTNTYTNDTVDWFLGRLTGATVTSTRP